MTPAQETELCTCLEIMLVLAEAFSRQYSDYFGTRKEKEQNVQRAEIARARAILKEVRG